MADYKAVDFDIFSAQCPYAYTFGRGDINNGYNCKHPEQEYREPAGSNNRLSVGRCHCISCPLGLEAEPQDMTDPDDPDAVQDIDWDGYTDPDALGDGDVFLCRLNNDKSSPGSRALFAYDLYLNRYNKQWLDAHGIENSLCD